MYAFQTIRCDFSIEIHKENAKLVWWLKHPVMCLQEISFASFIL